MRPLALSLVVFLGVACTESGSSAPAKRAVDLDGVLNVLVSTIEQVDSAVTEPGQEGDLDLQPLEATPEDARMETSFARMYAENLNANPQLTHYPTHLGVTFQGDGALKAFEDANQTGAQEEGEKDVFKVEVDAENQRLVATDLQNSEYRRDSRLRMSGVGLFSGFLLGRMLGNSNMAGLAGNRFNGQTMSERGYHSRIGAARFTGGGGGGARGAGGSRSTSFGK